MGRFVSKLYWHSRNDINEARYNLYCTKALSEVSCLSAAMSWYIISNELIIRRLFGGKHFKLILMLQVQTVMVG